MRKTDNILFFCIMFLLYPFFWLYEQIGATLFWILILCCFVGFFYYWKKKSLVEKIIQKKPRQLQHSLDEKTFYKQFFSACWDTINLPSAHPDVMRNSSLYYMSHPLNRQHAECIRNLQIIRDSIDIVRKSKNEDTIKERMQVLHQLYDEAGAMSYLFKPHDFQKLEKRFNELVSPLYTTIYLGVSEGYIIKMESVKTDKTKLKYLLKAIKIIESGLFDDNSNKDILRKVLSDLKEHPLYLEEINNSSAK